MSSSPLSPHQLWLISLSEPLTTKNDDSSAELASGLADSAQILSDWWNIENREQLLSTLNWLKSEGHRKAWRQKNGLSPNDSEQSRFLAWDYGRFASLVRWGTRAELLTSEEGWEHLQRIETTISDSFSSWKDYLEDYASGHSQWSSEPAQQKDTRESVEAALSKKLPEWSPSPTHASQKAMSLWQVALLFLGLVIIGGGVLAWALFR